MRSSGSTRSAWRSRWSGWPITPSGAKSWDKAFVYLRRAGAKAAERLALREAATALEQATSVAGRLPRQRELMEQAIDLCIQLRGVLFPLSEFDKVNIHLKSAAALATEIGDQTRLAQSTVFEAHYHCIIAGDMSQALECVHRAVDLASTTGSAPIQAGARFVLGLVLHGCGRFGEAVGTLSDNVHRMRADNLEDERAGFGLPIVVASRVWLSFALAELGRFADGFAAADAAIAHAESLAQPYSIYHAYWARAAVHLAKGDAAGIRESVARIEQITGEVFQLAANAAGLLGYANALSERTAEAIECLEGLVLRGTPRRNAYSPRPRHVLSLGETYLLAGQPARALDTVREVLEQSIALGQRGNEAYALCLVGDAHAALGARAEADASYREAITLAGELAMRPLVAHCHRGLGQLARRTGKRDQAHEHLTTATTMYREMDMRFYLEQAEAQLREVTE